MLKRFRCGFGAGRSRLGVAAITVIALAAIAIAGCGSSSSPTGSGRSIQSLFQDDQYLLYEPTPKVIKAVNTIKSLGATDIRVTVLWSAIAPDPNSTTAPAGFAASNPAAYPLLGLARYDRLVELARAGGLGVDFNVTADGPLWAMKGTAPEAHYAHVYEPSASDFEQFVTALGRRYDGSFVPPPAEAKAFRSAGIPVSGALPRVSYWSVWNEPNQPGWLSPQWHTVNGKRVMASPVMYRSYVDAVWKALNATGHGTSTDTILVGELAPEGCTTAGTAGCMYLDSLLPIPPMGFLRALYCVGPSYRPLMGAAATVLDCPASGSRSAFVSANPGLFDATGFSHHPYSFFLAPNVAYTSPGTGGYVPLVSLSRLEDGIDSIFASYGVSRQIPIYLTEYGYETNPPNPFRGVPLAKQALYLDEAQYMAWQDPRVRSMSQFLLYDSAPNTAFAPGTPGYWSSFQTGLLYVNGAKKPAFAAYRLPIYLPSPAAGAGGSVLVWGMLRPASGSGTKHALIQWRAPGGAYRTVASVSSSNPSGVFTVKLKPPGTGVLRIAWTAPSGQVFHSRAASVSG